MAGPQGVTDAEAGPGSAPRWIVGIGSSAGGLEALCRFLSGLPAALPAAIVVVQHMSHTHRSLLVELLARETRLRVVEIAAGSIPQAGTVHVSPAKVNVEIFDGRFRLHPAETPGVPVPSVNRFFLSLADAWGAFAVAVVLSGTGSDGAQGLRAVKLAGGTTFAQDAESARYAGMPQASVETGSVDLTLPPEAIAGAIVKLVCADEGASRTLPVPEPLPARLRVLRMVRDRTGVDLALYKESTVERRIARRISALRLPGLEEYLARCASDPGELDRLLKETLISVTSFFRDRESFASLEPAIREIVAGKQGRDEVRVWVSGCATGEEVYSIAMLFQEAIGASADPPRLKMFATDIDMNAMQVARRGVYGAAIAGAVSPARLERFFTPVKEGFEVRAELRDTIVFARHDITRDPPFLRIDLASCRNLLIYFKPSLQARVVPMLGYATAPRGFLFLGKSESISQFGDLFTVVDKTSRLFRSRGARPDVFGFAPQVREEPAPRRDRVTDLGDAHRRAVNQLHAPPSLLVTREGQILSVSGEASRYLSFPNGRLQFNIGNVMPSSDGVEAQSLLQRAARTRARVTGRTHPGTGNGPYRLVVDPMPDDESHYLMAFLPGVEIAPVDGPVSAADRDVNDTLRNELAVTREHLQTVIEELETSNEEMQALNEELQSSNEELQSTNEELETSNEELQSTNEELTTVNDELARRAEQLGTLGIELAAIMRSLPYPVMLFDKQLRLVRHNPAAERLLALGADASDIPITALQIPPELVNFAGEIADVARGHVVPEHRVRIGDQEYLLLIALCEGAGVEGGVLVEMVEVTSVAHAERSLRTSEARLRTMLGHAPMMVATTDTRGVIDYANPSFVRASTRAAAPVGRLLWECFEGSCGEIMKRRAGQVMTSGRLVEGEDQWTQDGRVMVLYSAWYPLYGPGDTVTGHCFMGMDVTELAEARNALARTEAVHDAALGALAAEIAVLDAYGDIISVNESWKRFAKANGAPEQEAWVGRNYLAACDVEKGCPPEVAPGLRAVLAGKSDRFEIEYPCDSLNEKRWFRLIAAGMRSGEARGVVMHIDITREKVAQLTSEARLEQEREHGKARERDLLQAIDEIEMFSYTVSHDLRAPLRAVISFSELLLSEHADGLAGAASEHVRRISQAGKRMHHYIDEILKLSHLARGSLATRDIDLSAMAEEIMSEARLLYPERAVEVNVRPGMRATADPSLLRAVMDNLIGNAWKYLDVHRKGEISVGCREEGGKTVFFVRDNGIGFDMSFREKLFMPFQRLHADENVKGHGLGLAAAKRIIVRHGGSIWAEARPGFGATFSFTLT